MITFANPKLKKKVMERIKLHDKYFKPFIPYEKIENAITVLAERMNADFNGVDTPIFLSVLNGSFMFTASLMKKINFNAEVSFIKLSSYSGTCSGGEVKQILGLNGCIKGRNVVIVEDIVDSGVTICELHKLLTEAEASSIKVCTLFLKPAAYQKDIKIDYAAMEIGNEFIVGFGLDYDQLGRQYKDIYIID